MGEGGWSNGEKIRTSDVAQRPLILWRREFGNPMVLASRYRGPKFYCILEKSPVFCEGPTKKERKKKKIQDFEGGRG